MNESVIRDVFESIYSTVISNIQTYLGKDSSGVFDSVTENNISISKYNSLAGSSYINLPKKLDCPRKWLINIQIIDSNEHLK